MSTDLDALEAAKNTRAYRAGLAFGVPADGTELWRWRKVSVPDTSEELVAKARDSITDWEAMTTEVDIELLLELTERLEAAEAVVTALRNALQSDFDQQTKATLWFELGKYDGPRLPPKQV